MKKIILTLSFLLLPILFSSAKNEGGCYPSATFTLMPNGNIQVQAQLIEAAMTGSFMFYNYTMAGQQYMAPLSGTSASFVIEPVFTDEPQDIVVYIIDDCDIMGGSNDYETFTLPPACYSDALFTYTRNNKELQFWIANDNSSVYYDTQYSWDFGDGQTAVGLDPIHEYATYGTYETCLTINQHHQYAACSDTYCTTIYLYPACNANFSITKQHNNTATFVPQVKSELFTYHWNFSDECEIDEPIATHTFYDTYSRYNDVENYEVCLTVQGILDGCMEQTCQTIRFRPSYFSNGAYFYHSGQKNSSLMSEIPKIVIQHRMLSIESLSVIEKIVLIDLKGQIVSENTIQNNKCTIDYSHLPPACYIYQLQSTDGHVLTDKLILE
jgi:hypothetical protein